AEERELLETHQEGFVKSQHNLDIEYDVQATIQPVASLTKDKVREILNFFNMPPELVYRKAFPGPALSARIIGPVTAENLDFEKRMHDLVESHVEDYYNKNFGKPMIINNKGEQEPFQVFAAVGEDIFKQEVTGLMNGKRIYELPQVYEGAWDYKDIIERATEIKGFSRLIVKLGANQIGKYDVVIRSINSKDARTATITELPLTLLEEMSQTILKFPKTKNVYFDVTPKPPATIEYV
ncbi:MAG: hypothetical protein ACFFE4_14125, partial [Candidatus Thorarchaeota archaeon]